MVCYMSHWALNTEQKEGSGGLLVAQGSALPARSNGGSVLNAFPPLLPETFEFSFLLPSLQQSRGAFSFYGGSPSRTRCPPGKVDTSAVACLTSTFICRENAEGHKSEGHPSWFGISL